MNKSFIVLLMGVFWIGVAYGKEAEYVGGDPEMYDRVMHVSGELRCLVCQGQSLADSNADFAVDMRTQIRELMDSGMTNREVVDFMVERYGDYVRYRPPFKASTALLWFGPMLLFAIGIATLYINVWRRKVKIDDQPLSEEDHRRAAELLGKDVEDRKV